MKLRISGTRAECAATVAAVSAVLAVREVSDFYPNRGATVLGRVYLDAEAPAARAPCRTCVGSGTRYYQAGDGEFVPASCPRCGSGLVGELGSGYEPTPESSPGPAVKACHSTRRAGVSNPTRM